MSPDERKFFDCSVCGHNRFQQLYRFGLFSDRQNVVVCRDCGTVCLNPRWDEKKYEEYYQKDYYGKYQPSVVTNEATDISKIQPGTRSNNIFKSVSQFIGKDGSILEIGCGTGENLVAFIQNGYHRLAGLDTSPDCCRQLQQRGITAINSSLDSYINEIRHPEQFDCIILSHMLEHFVQPEKALDIISGLVNPTGILYILVPDFYGFSQPFAQFTIPHTFYFGEASLGMLLNNCGYTINKHCKSEPGEIALVAKKSGDKLKPVTSKNNEYQKVLSFLKKKKLYYIKIRAKQIFESLAGWLIMHLMREETWVNLRGRLRRLHILP